MASKLRPMAGLNPRACLWCNDKGFSMRAYEGRDRKVPCPKCAKGQKLKEKKAK